MLNPLPTSSSTDRELWLKRLRYRSEHRGCKETDLVLATYCARQLAGLTDEELHCFEAFLEEDDANIWNWLVEKTPCPNPRYDALLVALRAQKIA